MMSLRLAAGTTGGTLFSTVIQLSWHDVGKTAVLAAAGAVVSFLVTLALQWLAKRRRRK